MHRLIAVAVFLSTAPATAAPFIEYGLGAADGCILRGWEVRNNQANISCSEKPLGFLSVGYEQNGWTLQAEHWSSLKQSDDYGVNFLSIKHRVHF